MSRLPTVSVIVPTRNNARELERDLLPSLFARKGDAFVQDGDLAPAESPWLETIIVDQSPQPEIRGSLEQAGLLTEERVRYLWTPEQRGISRARNAGLVYASGQIVTFLDSDIIVGPSHITTIARTFAAHPEIAAMYAPVLVHQPTYDQRGGTIPCFEPARAQVFRRLEPRGLGMGANLAIVADLARRLEFDEFLGVGTDFPSFEDIDIVVRLSEAGFPYGVFLEPAVEHTGVRIGDEIKRWARDTARGCGARDAKSLRAGDLGSVGESVRTILGLAWNNLRSTGRPQGLTRLAPYFGGLIEALSLYELDRSSGRYTRCRSRPEGSTLGSRNELLARASR